MTIRAYRATDRNECIGIFKSNMPMYFDPVELPALENWLSGKDEGRLSYETNLSEHFYVVVSNEKVIACGGFYIPRNEHRGNMVWGMVHNSQHKKGIGRNLMEFRIQTIKKLFPDYTISLDTTQHSYKFFGKFGFSVTKVTKDFYGKGLDRYDMLNN